MLRLPASALQLAGMIPASGPTWYEALQGVIGVVQFSDRDRDVRGLPQSRRLGRVLILWIREVDAVKGTSSLATVVRP